MNISKTVLFAIIICLFQLPAFSQVSCGFDLIRNNKIKTDPAFRKQQDQNELNIRRYINAHKSQAGAREGGVLYTIPVVVHVVHTGDAIGTTGNPSDNQITATINYLNQVYNGSAGGIEGAGDLQIQFVLAKRDLYCGPSNGINRVDGRLLDGYTDNGISLNGDKVSYTTLWEFVHWPPEDFFNIYVVNKISGNAPGGFGVGAFAAGNGVVINAVLMEAGQKTLPHEMGHIFGLYHVFEGASETGCPPYSSTDATIAETTGDLIGDTDPIDLAHASWCTFTAVNTCTIDAGNPTGNLHNKNTENNFMNYSPCNTLFTAGQKARMLATAATNPMLISLSASLGGTTVSANNPCATKISFEKTDDTKTETTAATAGCRAYKDYLYNLVISGSPAIPATVTLQLNAGGTASEGADFDITTNGDFLAASKSIVFPVGSHAAQSFTIRIYDDAIVEGEETCTLGFAINNNDGATTKADNNTTLAFTISDNDIAPNRTGNTMSTTIGNSQVPLNRPFDLVNPKQRTQVLYTKDELAAAGVKAGNILGFALNLFKTSATGFGYSAFTVRMAQTMQNSLNNFSNELPLNSNLFTTVFTSNYYITTDGQNTFNFPQPYVWGGLSNIVLEFCYDNGNASSNGTDFAMGYNEARGRNVTVFKLGADCGADFGNLNTSSSVTAKPAIVFTWQEEIAPPPVETQLNSSKQEWLGPGADVYFYDAADNKLLARIKNTSSFNYGCTQVIVDRNNNSAGSGAVPFLKNTPANYLLSKTLKVIPAVNNPSGNYEISLYYTKAETDAWQMATGQSINNIKVVKTTGNIADVTPDHPSGAGTIAVATPVVSKMGTNTVLTAAFNTGFSGFGAGVISFALPIKLLDFKGALQNHTVALSWGTASENNSKSFEIERSYNGVDFARVGTIRAAGNSSAAQYYTFTDPVTAKENNYYRLKQIDTDDQFEYSNVILVKDPGTTTLFRVISNPFTTSLTLEFGRTQTGKIDTRLMDITGKEVFHAVNNMQGLTRAKLDLTGKNIAAGIYLLLVKNGQQQFIQRVIKQ